MLARTSSPLSPWIVVRADDKHSAQLNVIRDLLARLACPQTDKHLTVPDLNVVFPYDEAQARAGPARDLKRGFEARTCDGSPAVSA